MATHSPGEYNMSKAELLQSLESRNQNIRDTIGGVYINTAKGILMKPPFAYSDAISSDVADGIVNYGDKLMANAVAEEDDQGEMEELNRMGDDFQAMQNSVAMMLTVDEDVAQEKNLEHGVVRKLYPLLPDEEFYIADKKVERFDAALGEIRTFLRTKARRGFTAVINFLGICNEDGIRFKSGQTIPLDIITNQVQQMLEGRGDQLAPMAVDVVAVKDGVQIVVKQIRAGHGEVVTSVVPP